MAGHLFIARGDLTKLACDAWLLPTDASGYVTPGWIASVPGLRDRVRFSSDALEALRTQRCWSLGRVIDEGPVIVAVHTGGRATTPAQWYADGAILAVGEARRRVPEARIKRQRPLIGLPFVGVGKGGGDAVKGDVVLALVQGFLEHLSERGTDYDVVLVTRSAAHHAAAQQARRKAGIAERPWTDLTGGEVRCAQGIARRARDNRLVLFLGAGISQAAGLPGWDQLLGRLAKAAREPIDPENPAFKKLDVRDRARLIRKRMPDDKFFRIMEETFTTEEASLAHMLLAGLPVTEAATTNYDELFETSWRALASDVAVLPGDSLASAKRWLLKLHGTVRDIENVVLTRDDYLEFDRRRSALAGMVQAMLITRHMLFVGYSMTDENFNRMVADVRGVLGGVDERPRGEPFGTALSPTSGGYSRDLWEGDIDVVDLSGGGDLRVGARRVEIFLDCVLAYATDTTRYLLDESFDALLTEDERVLRGHLQAMTADWPRDSRSPTWDDVMALVGGLHEE